MEKEQRGTISRGRSEFLKPVNNFQQRLRLMGAGQMLLAFRPARSLCTVYRNIPFASL